MAADRLLVFTMQKLYSSEETHRHMVHCIDMGWFVLNKYYALFDQSPVYAAALRLDPSKRRKYIERNWKKPWQAPAIAATHKNWLDEYKSAAIPDLRVPPDMPLLPGGSATSFMSC